MFIEMKLEFLKDTGDELYEEVLRLYDFTEKEVLALKNILEKRVIEEKSFLEFHSLDFIDALNCKLTIHYTFKNEKMKLKNYNVLEWSINTSICKDICKKLELIFLGNGYYWLNPNDDSEISFLLSLSGGW